MITRQFAAHIAEILSLFPVVALIGPRQVGKSTLVTADPIASGRTYTTMDSIATRSLAESDLVAFLDSSAPMTIDEVQLVPTLLREIKRRVDAERRPGQYLLTGSADLNYAADISHVLAGRVGVVELPPITRFERLSAPSGHPPLWLQMATHGPDGARESDDSTAPPAYRWSELFVGGFPISVTAASSRARELWFESFRMTYIERDLRRLSDIGNLSAFARLMELTAVRTGTILNQASLAREAGVPAQTAGRYLSLLEASLLIRRVPAWHSNIGKRIVKSPRIYWRDAALAAYLAGVPEESIETHRSRGALFETAVIGEIAALLPLFAPGARLHHLRTHDGLEIDAIISLRDRLVPVEVKASLTVTPGDAAAIETWMDRASGDTPPPANWGLVIYAGSDVRRLSRRVWAVPLA